MRVETTAAFNVLRALDPQETLRRELLAAGVSRARVLGLYPHDFSPLAPQIIEILRKRRDVLSEFPPLAKWTGNVLLLRGEFQLTTVNYPKIATAYASAVKEDRGLVSITDWVKANAEGNDVERDWLALKAGEMLWFSHAFMTHFSELTPAHQADAANLIEAVTARLFAPEILYGRTKSAEANDV